MYFIVSFYFVMRDHIKKLFFRLFPFISLLATSFQFLFFDFFVELFASWQITSCGFIISKQVSFGQNICPQYSHTIHSFAFMRESSHWVKHRGFKHNHVTSWARLFLFLPAQDCGCSFAHFLSAAASFFFSDFSALQYLFKQSSKEKSQDFLSFSFSRSLRSRWFSF